MQIDLLEVPNLLDDMSRPATSTFTSPIVDPVTRRSNPLGHEIKNDAAPVATNVSDTVPEQTEKYSFTGSLINTDSNDSTTVTNTPDTVPELIGKYLSYATWSAIGAGAIAMAGGFTYDCVKRTMVPGFWKETFDSITSSAKTSAKVGASFVLPLGLVYCVAKYEQKIKKTDPHIAREDFMLVYVGLLILGVAIHSNLWH